MTNISADSDDGPFPFTGVRNVLACPVISLKYLPGSPQYLTLGTDSPGLTEVDKQGPKFFII